ncbi:hypothetical protein D3C81_1968020 [compost metagenome]
MRSIPLTTARMDEFFTRFKNWLPMEGVAILMAWGKITWNMVWLYVRPVARAASLCPLGMDWIPARIHSAIKAAVYTVRPKVPDTNPSKGTPREAGP